MAEVYQTPFWSSLTQDVFSLIVQHCDQRALRALRLVCKGWAEFVLEVTDHTRITRALTTQSASFIAGKLPALRSLALDYEMFTDGRERSSKSAQLTNMPQLQVLELSSKLSFDDAPVWVAQHQSQLSHLKLCSSFEQRHYDLSSLSSLQSLRRLDIDDCDGEFRRPSNTYSRHHWNRFRAFTIPCQARPPQHARPC